MTAQIPVTNEPQSFQIALAGKDYILTCKWNDAEEGGWVLDFADADTETPIVANVPLITGRNILDGLAYLGIGGELWVYVNGDETAVPTLLNLGVEGFLYFVTEEL